MRLFNGEMKQESEMEFHGNAFPKMEKMQDLMEFFTL